MTTGNIKKISEKQSILVVIATAFILGVIVFLYASVISLSPEVANADLRTDGTYTTERRYRDGKWVDVQIPNLVSHSHATDGSAYTTVECSNGYTNNYDENGKIIPEDRCKTGTANCPIVEPPPPCTTSSCSSASNNCGDVNYGSKCTGGTGSYSCTASKPSDSNCPIDSCTTSSCESPPNKCGNVDYGSKCTGGTGSYSCTASKPADPSGPCEVIPCPSGTTKVDQPQNSCCPDEDVQTATETIRHTHWFFFIPWTEEHVTTIKTCEIITTPTAALSCSPSLIEVGQSSTINWSCANSDSSSGTNFSTGGNTSGSVSVSPTIDKTYSVTCTKGSGAQQKTASDTCEVKTGVCTDPAGCTLSPKCDSFTATPSTLPSSGGDVTLNWNTSNATDVRINNGVGLVNADGSKRIRGVTYSTTYTLTARKVNETPSSCSASVTVGGNPPPPPPPPPPPITCTISSCFVPNVCKFVVPGTFRTCSDGSVTSCVPNNTSNTIVPLNLGESCPAYSKKCDKVVDGFIGCNGVCNPYYNPDCIVDPPCEELGTCPQPGDITVDISAIPSLVTQGSKTVVSWNSTETDSCKVTNSANTNRWNGRTGEKNSSEIEGKTTYTLSCIGYDGSTISTSTAVRIVPKWQEF